MTDKRWLLGEQPPPGAVTELCQATPGLEPVLACLLWQRQLRTPDQIAAWLSPTLDQLHDPALMCGMGRALEILDEALASGEPILVLGDYDVDGMTAAALVYDHLGRMATDPGQLSWYLPDRFGEGYGVSEQAVDDALARGARIILTLDCGTKAVEAVAYGVARGVRFIICDHHLPGPVLPAAEALLNPHQEGCSYPFKSLTGCGIGFKLLEGLYRRRGIEPDSLYDDLDLVALSTIADLAPVTGENRVLVSLGLARLNAAPRPGIRALLEASGYWGRQIGVTECLFSIIPRLNAAGRMAHAGVSLELLLARTDDEAQERATYIQGLNERRQQLDRQITQEALETVRRDPEQTSAWATIVYNPNWHKGVVGIVATRLVEHFYRPAVVLTHSRGQIVGSVRSVKEFDLTRVLDEVSPLLEQYGGHRQAAGLALHPDNYEAFRRSFERAVQRHLSPEQKTEVLEADLIVPLKAITPTLHEQIQKLAPFGPGNPQPVFLSERLRLQGPPRTLTRRGSGESVGITLALTQENGSRRARVEAVGWGLQGLLPTLEAPRVGNLEACYTLDERTLRPGADSVRITLKDLRVQKGR